MEKEEKITKIFLEDGNNGKYGKAQMKIIRNMKQLELDWKKCIRPRNVKVESPKSKPTKKEALKEAATAWLEPETK